MEVQASCCAIYNCESCDYRKDEKCAGCWSDNLDLKERVGTACAVFECVVSQQINSCRECTEPGCRLRRNIEIICPLRGRFEKKRWWAGRMSRAIEKRKRRVVSSDHDGKMSERVANRLRWYLAALDSFEAEGYDSVSSWQLAERVGFNSALIRKDLSRFGEFGTPSYGYRTAFLRDRIKTILRLDKPHGIVWIGACMLRHYTSAIERLCRNNCRLLGVFDVEESEIGLEIGEFTVRHVDRMNEVISDAEVSVAVIAAFTPRAQHIADALVDLGAKAILNLSGQILILPDKVRLCSLDIVGELLELCYYC